MRKNNVILIIIDTLRSDTFFNSLDHFTNFNRYIGDFNIYRDVISPSPWTLPSHFSLFSGKYVSEHGMDRTRGEINYYDFLRRVKQTNLSLLADELKSRNFTTLGYSANPFISPDTGIDRGFDSFVTVEQRKVPKKLQGKLDEIKKNGSTIKDIITSVLRYGNMKLLVNLPFIYYQFRREQEKNGFPKNKGGSYMIDLFQHTSIRKPFFAFFNLMEMHEPYLLTETLSNPFGGFHDILGISRIPNSNLKKMKSVYDSQILVVDQLLANLLDHLKSIGSYNDSLIIVTSDHGQAFRENNYYGHGLFLYDEIIKVPLIIKYPSDYSGAKERVDSLIDIYGLVMKYVDEMDLNMTDSGSKPVFSESYGTFIDEKDFAHHKEAFNRLIKINSNRKAVFKDGYKLTINGSTGYIEEFSFEGKKIEIGSHEEMLRSLMEELEIFKGKEKFIIKGEVQNIEPEE